MINAHIESPGRFYHCLSVIVKFHEARIEQTRYHYNYCRCNTIFFDAFRLAADRAHFRRFLRLHAPSYNRK